jgi:hypothetical protein
MGAGAVRAGLIMKLQLAAQNRHNLNARRGLMRKRPRMILWIIWLAAVVANRSRAIISSNHDTTTQFSHVRFCRQKLDVVGLPLDRHCAALADSEASRFLAFTFIFGAEAFRHGSRYSYQRYCRHHRTDNRAHVSARRTAAMAKVAASVKVKGNPDRELSW